MLANDPQSAADIVVFTIAAIALMQALAWLRQREPGILWFAAASLLTTLLVAGGNLATPVGVQPSLGSLLVMYLVRALFALGLIDCLGLSGRRRRVVSAVVVLPGILVAAALLAGAQLVGRLAALPMLWADLAMVATCLLAARREPGLGHATMAIAPAIGPVAVAIDIWRHDGAHPGHNFTLASIGFGIVVLFVVLMRRSRDGRDAQAHAQRMSNYYVALSHTNQAIVRIGEPLALYEEVCRICVESAQARMACVYLGDGDVAHRVALSGTASEIFRDLGSALDVGSPAGGLSYTAEVLRTGHRLVSNDYQHDERAGAWQALARRHGIHAIAFLPLRRGTRTIGVLMVAASEIGIFDGPLVRLLDEMNADISFALDNLEREARHREAQRQVEAGLERFARMFQSAPVASAILSIEDRRVLDVNDAMCALQHATRDELIGHTTDSLAYRAVHEDRERFYATLQREGRVHNMVMRMSNDEGHSYEALMNAEPIDYLGRPCLIYTSLDISDMRAAEEARRQLVEARAASDAKTQFLSSMSHELRTPLNAVIGFSSLLRHESGAGMTPHQLAQLDHVQQAGWHLLQLINDVLDLSRIEAGQFGVQARAIELGPLLEEAIQMSRPLAAQRQVRLDADGGEAEPVWALADPTRLRQVLLNLLSNGIKYNRGSGSVHLRATRHDSQAVIEVVDTGLGMSPQQLAHLFEPFNRLGRQHEGYEGTGIGLSLTRQLMQLMNGDVRISSEEGRGTRVVLTLPAASAVATEQRAREAPSGDLAPPLPAPPDATDPRGTVLYIEDNAVNALLVEQLLARWESVRFVGAMDGTTGVQMALTLRPDLVLLDRQLPDIDGIEVLERLRASEALRETPIIMLSASAMPEDIARARSGGANDYWTKPLDFKRFLAGVAEALKEGRGARDDTALDGVALRS